MRSAGRSGRDVLVTDDTRHPICSYSKYCSKFLSLPSPSRWPKEFLLELIEILRIEDIDLVVPMDDSECDILSDIENKRLLTSPVALPSSDAYYVARDKNKTQLLARRLGIPTPDSCLITSPESIGRIGKEVGFPAIVKPIKSSGSRGFRLIRDEASLVSIPCLLSKYGSLLAQEFIPSQESIGVSYLFNRGEIRASFSHRRLLEFPTDGGPSLVRESIANGAAQEFGQRLLESLSWHGIAMVEFRIDSRTGTPVLLEINPRFWGSLPLAIASGVDFPSLLCEMYERGDVARTDSYMIGRRCMNIIPFGIASIVGVKRARYPFDLLRHAMNCRCFDVESFNDPLPTLGGVVAMLESAFDRELVEAFLRRTI
jgi:predicted ATP-grasp superfamily ATP-dependent carboligase